MIKRPILLRLLPLSFRQRVYSRFFAQKHQRFIELFKYAPLEFANGVAMHDLLPGDIICGNIAFTGFYELSLTKTIRELAKRGGLIVDVGANIGYFSLLWASTNDQCRVICFEASPRNLEMLKTNVELNSLSGRVTIHPKAAGKEQGTIEFDLGPAEQTGWGGMHALDRLQPLLFPLFGLMMKWVIK